MVPRTIFDLAKPQKNLIKIQLNLIKNMNHDIFSAVIACLRLHQKQIKKLNFQDSQLDKNSGL